MSFTASVATKTVVTGYTLTLTSAETVETFKLLLGDAMIYGPDGSRSLAREIYNALSDKESAAVNGYTSPEDYARGSAVVGNLIADGKRLLAIKEVRTQSSCGLKEAKDAIDKVYPLSR